MMTPKVMLGHELGTNAGQLKLIMLAGSGAERHETGLSVRWGDMKVGFHVVPGARDAGGGDTDGS
jgi:hypothetical protein